MAKILTFLVAGVALAVVAMLAMRDVSPGMPEGDELGSHRAAEILEALQALQAGNERRFASIEQRLEGLVDELEALRERTASVEVPQQALELQAPVPRSPTPDEAYQQENQRHEEMRRLALEAYQQTNQGHEELRQRALELGIPVSTAEQRRRQQLLAAGFTPGRIDWINRRLEEVTAETRQEQLSSLDPNLVFTALEPAALLRPEMGDAEYELYRTALGLSTSAGIDRVPAGSAAEQAGLRAGDEIFGYGGKRLFSRAELDALTRESEPLGWVVVDVMRDGQHLQLTLPGGPIPGGESSFSRFTGGLPR